MIETYQFETNTINMISSKIPLSFKVDGEFITLVCTYLVKDFLRYVWTEPFAQSHFIKLQLTYGGLWNALKVSFSKFYKD